MIKVHEKSLADVIDKSVAQIQERSQHFEGARIMAQLLRTNVEWRWSELMRQVVYAKDSKSSEVELSSSIGDPVMRPRILT